MYGDSYDREITADGFEVLARFFHYFCVWRQPALGNTAGGFEVLARCFNYFYVWRQP